MTIPQQTRVGDDVARLDDQLHLACAGLDDDLADQLGKLCAGYGDRIRVNDPLGPIIANLTRSLVAAGFVVHDCAARQRTGGVCLTSTTAGQTGVIVTWFTHDALAIDGEQYRENSDVIDLMNFTLADVLCTMGWATEPFGRAGSHVVTGRLAARESDDE